MLTLHKRICYLIFVGAFAVCHESSARAETARPDKTSSMKNATDLLRASASVTSDETELHQVGVLCTISKQLPVVLTISDIQLGTCAARSGLAVGDTILQVDKMGAHLYVTVKRAGKVYRADLSDHIEVTEPYQQPTSAMNIQGETDSTRIGTEKQRAHRERHRLRAERGEAGSRGTDGMADIPPNRLPTLNYSQMVAKYGDITSKFCDLRIARFYDPTNQMLQDQVVEIEAQLSTIVETNGGRWHAVEYYGPHSRPWPNNQPDPRYLLNAGVRLFAIGDVRNAKRLFLEVARFAPNNGDALFNLGALAERENDIQEATADYQKAAMQQTTTRNTRPELDAPMALRNVGQVPILFEGGLDIGSPRYRGLTRQGTCSICRIMRNAIMDGH